VILELAIRVEDQVSDAFLCFCVGDGTEQSKAPTLSLTTRDDLLPLIMRDTQHDTARGVCDWQNVKTT
jgi:hypothetical protein